MHSTVIFTLEASSFAIAKLSPLVQKFRYLHSTVKLFETRVLVQPSISLACDDVIHATSRILSTMATIVAEHEPLVRLELDRRAQSSIIEDGTSHSGGGEEKSCKTESDDGQNNTSHGSSVIQTALNMTKLCMGTGTLALPFAAEKGGLLFNVVGLALIAIWNYYCANCVLRCRDCLPQTSNCGDSYSDMERPSARQQQIYGSVDDPESLQQPYKRKPPPVGTTSYASVAWYAAGPA
eukprot:scaffold705_cov86-Skeletonema_menzelii.AAC.1